VDQCDDRGELHSLLKVQTNYWFRHVWEYWWPLYPGVLLALDLTGLDIWQFALLQFPLTLAAVAGGILFLLRRVQLENAPEPPPRDAGADGIVSLLSPIVLVVAVYAAVRIFLPGVAEYSRYLPMALGIVAAIVLLQIKRPLPAATWRAIVTARKTWLLALLVTIVRVYGALIETPLPGGESLVAAMQGELARWGIPVALMVALIPFFSGLATGLAIGFVGASFPVILSLIGADPEPSQLMATALLGYACGYVGMMLSPVHICLIVTNEHFQTRLTHSLPGLLAPGAVVVTFAVVAYTAIRLFGG
jgi:integral membrane protein (TIGR00529 family)